MSSTGHLQEKKKQKKKIKKTKRSWNESITVTSIGKKGAVQHAAMVIEMVEE